MRPNTLANKAHPDDPRTICAAITTTMLRNMHPPGLKKPQIQMSSSRGCVLKVMIHEVLLPWGSSVCLKQCLGWFCESNYIYMNTRSQCFPLQHCTSAMNQCTQSPVSLNTQ